VFALIGKVAQACLVVCLAAAAVTVVAVVALCHWLAGRD